MLDISIDASIKEFQIKIIIKERKNIMFTEKRQQALQLGLAMILVVLGVYITSLKDTPVLAYGLEIISGNDRADISGPATEPALLAGLNTRKAGTQVMY
jgi:hypothetical protein